MYRGVDGKDYLFLERDTRPLINIWATVSPGRSGGYQRAVGRGYRRPGRIFILVRTHGYVLRPAICEETLGIKQDQNAFQRRQTLLR
jgi:hypothetical protein